MVRHLGPSSKCFRRSLMAYVAIAVGVFVWLTAPISNHLLRAQENAATEENAESSTEKAATEGKVHDDPQDLTHQNASANLHSALDLRADQVIGTIAVFVFLLLFLWKLAWGPITNGLDKREESIKSLIDEAKRNHEAAAARLREYEARLTAAAEESRAIIAQAQKDAVNAAERIKADAAEAAQRERTRAVADIQAAKNAALDEIVQKSVDMAVSLAGRIVQKQLTPSDHANLIREAIDNFPSRN